ncbi:MULTISPECIES: TetR/AcrR family transcriptional regulator [unclassified Bradyrhizobium]|uniref:TetR/AcrR family transcriptional regulator n=1 Tax=unclassified Bradyrhizobium TaxID=2631580 RepID=UPI00247A91C4|nr:MULTISPECIES: TetR/AcrR family transcriptional regulator [unclassified Bradyrhizobium]WGS18527.1 TetR family transcriptional regulator [Bradyrhizobium sp. ISRA463]WGS25352.1 TetR family transcriptional regulator [Bradyrhizobium sp. ISRA464]
MNEKPRKRDSIQTQERILAAAKTEFARKGYDGARVDAIIARAKISKNLLYHHFHSKEELYVRVLERTYETLRRRQGDVPLTGLDPVEAMRRLCESTFQTFIDEPDVIVILNTENLHRGKHIAKSPIIRSLYNRLSNSIQTILAEGQGRGVFRSGIDPVELYISISALGYFYLSNRYTLSMIFDRDLKQPDDLKRRKAHIVEVILAYLTTGVGPSPAAPLTDERSAQKTT